MNERKVTLPTGTANGIERCLVRQTMQQGGASNCSVPGGILCFGALCLTVWHNQQLFRTRSNVALPSDANRLKALDLGSDDWAWLYELAFWLGPEDQTTDHFEYVPSAQGALLSLLDDGLAEVAEMYWESQRYDIVDDARARAIVLDPQSWRTAHDLGQQESPVLFAYCATEAGRQLYFASRGAV